MMEWNCAKSVCTALVLAGVVTLVFGCSNEPAQPATPSFDEARSQALEEVAARDVWPATPEDLCKAFWDARAEKDYKEMAILWPGSASFDWPAICKDDPDVTYIFGTATGDPPEVPYAAEEDYLEQGAYDLKMRVESVNTPKGPRYVITSGN